MCIEINMCEIKLNINESLYVFFSLSNVLGTPFCNLILGLGPLG